VCEAHEHAHVYGIFKDKIKVVNNHLGKVKGWLAEGKNPTIADF
jgi:hypothetical protein